MEKLTHAEAFHIAPAGRISSAWKREGEGVALTLAIPEGMHGQLRAPKGWLFEDGRAVRPAASGEYRLLPARVLYRA